MVAKITSKQGVNNIGTVAYRTICTHASTKTYLMPPEENDVFC
jgi:hypothetical protein